MYCELLKFIRQQETKRLKAKIKAKLKKAWAWLRRNVLTPQMIVYVIIAELIFWSPCLVGLILGATINAWFYTIPTVYIAFWAGPGTPAIPIQMGIALGLKAIITACRTKEK